MLDTENGARRIRESKMFIGGIGTGGRWKKREGERTNFFMQKAGFIGFPSTVTILIYCLLDFTNSI